MNNGAPINPQNGHIGENNDPETLSETGVAWIRVNFILGPWTSPDDNARHGRDNLTWFETYDRIVDGMVAKGLKVYGLIGGEAVRNSSRDRLNTEEYVREYTENFVKIVDHFKGRIQVYESFNEPNDWAGGSTSQVTPRWFARYLESIYRAVKIDDGHLADPEWQAVTLVSGPLFTHPTGPGGDYFTRTWKAGKEQLEWENVKDVCGSYPFDGVGIHIYVAEGNESKETLIELTQQNLDSVHESLRLLEGPDVNKRFYVSEFGFQSATLSEQVQAEKMDIAWSVYENDPRVAVAFWFSLQDFPHGMWGVYRGIPYTEANQKPAYQVLRRRAGQ